MRRAQFCLPENQVYLCGHSLGPMTCGTQNKVDQAMVDWKTSMVKAWNTADWIDLPHAVAALIAPLVGAFTHEVILSDSTSVNLYKLLQAALKLQPKRSVILTTHDNFSADLYITAGVASSTNKRVLNVPPEEVTAHFNEEVAVLIMSHVNYRTAVVYDMTSITQLAQAAGILVIWDVSHSVGIVPMQLHHANVDMAVGCTYKYLNGGPGSPAFVYVHERHHASLDSPIYGWMGHVEPFAFKPTYESHGIAKMLGGTPYILSLKALEGALEVFHDLDLEQVKTQCDKHAAYLLRAFAGLGLKALAPLSQSRGGHVAFEHRAAYAISRALIERGIICDYRAPGVIRCCVNPLYLSVADLHICIDNLQIVIEQRLYTAPEYQTQLKVT